MLMNKLAWRKRRAFSVEFVTETIILNGTFSQMNQTFVTKLRIFSAGYYCGISKKMV